MPVRPGEEFATKPSPAPSQSGNRICAILVTYRPWPGVLANLEAVRRQVRHVIVVDNGSSDNSQALLASLAGDPAVELVFNRENLGIATALNQGVTRALARDFDWIATFDQDSTVPEGYIAGLLAAHATYPERERVAVLAPLYRDRHLGFVFSPGGPMTADSQDDVPVSVTATSGNLVSAAALRAVGGFRDDFFIDLVDFEFCLRCRRAGWLVLEVRRVILDHAVGRLRQRRLLWKRAKINDYDAFRRYYQARNRLIVGVHFVRFDPRWVLRDAWDYGCDFIKLLLFGENRWIKLRAIMAGFLHAVTGRRGKWHS